MTILDAVLSVARVPLRRLLLASFGYADPSAQLELPFSSTWPEGISIGAGSHIGAGSRFVLLEGQRVDIGRDVRLGRDVVVCAGADVRIRDGAFVGDRTIIAGGASIPADCALPAGTAVGDLPTVILPAKTAAAIVGVVLLLAGAAAFIALGSLPLGWIFFAAACAAVEDWYWAPRLAVFVAAVFYVAFGNWGEERAWPGENLIDALLVFLAIAVLRTLAGMIRRYRTRRNTDHRGS